ncbi:MAG: sulfite oxidase-like oxidoreductase [Dehalococcoidia bacterium]|nr:sulfite oxidase-like oxidoreductase [Dehalococcoidia bacterium]
MVEPHLPRPPKEIRQELEAKRRERVPGGQFVTDKFPVLTYGPTPKVDLATFRLRLFGLVEKECELTWQQLLALPKTVMTADFHCVTQWSRLENTWEGVRTEDVVKLIKLRPEVSYVMVHCYGGYSTNISLEDFLEENVLFAHRHDGKELPADHGGPLRLVIPQLYGWKSAKWVSGVEFIKDDRPGFWEERGYHMRGDPWKEERFWDELM